MSAWRSVRSSEPALGEQRFLLARCARCGSAVTLGDAPAGLYESGAYRPGAPRLHRISRPVLRMFERQRLSLVRSLTAPPARLLDAGSGRGRFVAAARAAGYDASGIEPSARGAEAAAALGVPVRRTSIEAAEIKASSLDVVTLWHVLEHLDDPGAALARVAAWLRPGGGLLVGVPNLASLQARIAGERWYHLDVPRHRTLFTPAGLQALLHASGFTVASTHHTLLEHNPFGMWQSLVSLLTRQPSYVYNLLKRNAPLRSPDLIVSVAALPLAPLAAAIELAASAAGHGGTIAVLARRAD
jgi:2-polyprenyl-3-methyl-5-hydroxy-6-metoxy-1,4-benzoquinol methylase